MGVKTVLTCDTTGCGKSLELDGPYFAIKEAMKAAGWRNVKAGDGWAIKCPGCAGK
jgi:hypothetical protein